MFMSYTNSLLQLNQRYLNMCIMYQTSVLDVTMLKSTTYILFQELKLRYLDRESNTLTTTLFAFILLYTHIQCIGALKYWRTIQPQLIGRAGFVIEDTCPGCYTVGLNPKSNDWKVNFFAIHTTLIIIRLFLLQVRMCCQCISFIYALHYD